ncbi:hypothetical protein C3H96_04150 [Campylobacter jejuni]|uniref:YopX family protein n=1 Tax=Campylobacter jejuni TaxID=197 RepID=UPI000F7FBA81|nr:YopX family protein [Campylobacter jejuni]RTI96841.1 hypothetical protein C3H96_04150 [Campylobacter jejuni]
MKLQDFDFRIWDGKKYINNIKGGVYIHKINDHIKCLNRNQDCYNYEFELDDLDNSNLEIELFTGLYDKNGKKIYEGDVIKYVYIFKHELLDKGMIKKLPKKVSIGCVGIDNFLGFRILKNKELQCFMKDIANIEIIGNIHENKELLK